MTYYYCGNMPFNLNCSFTQTYESILIICIGSIVNSYSGCSRVVSAQGGGGRVIFTG